MTESQTRQILIDKQLAEAGWSINIRNVVEEHSLQSSDEISSDGFADYVLLGTDRAPMAVVEAKRASRDVIAGQRQVQEYGERIRESSGKTPFLYLANGREILFWDWPGFPPRKVARFHSPDDLERARFLRRFRKSLTEFSPSTRIAGYRRPYQVEAIKRVTEAFESGQRKCLLVMATGTGKTRVAAALVDLLFRARWAQRVLFLVDRRALGRQALATFGEYLPQEPRARVEGGVVDPDARIHVATYPSMMQVYHKISTGFYDIIIADESHRSIYNRYKVIFEHFDALQLGLTATPTDFIDHNTFDLFHCPDGLPTFYYPFEQAVEEGYLVNYRVLEAKTRFQVTGIKAGALPADIQAQLQQQGVDLADLDFEGSELERRVSNSGTNDVLVAEFMEKCRKDATGTLPAKAIFFAMSHAHARALWESFNRLYPNLQAQGLAQIIDSHMERAETLLDDFRYRDMPRVAISVDMLDTGIDIPSVQTLVFAKPIFSQVKFWQMIGRGTRLWSDPLNDKKKEDFLIIDYWDNFAFFRMQPTGESEHTSEPLPVRLFRVRLQKLLLLSEPLERSATIRDLAGMLAQLPENMPAVRSHSQELALWSSETPLWETLTHEAIAPLTQVLAPLLRWLPEVQLPAMLFELRTEQFAVAWLTGQIKEIQSLRAAITQDLQRLPMNLSEVQAAVETITWAQSEGFWNSIDLGRIRMLREVLAPLLVYRQSELREMISLHLPDTIAERRWIVYGPGGEGAFVGRYKDQVEAQVRTLAEELPALDKLRTGEPLTLDDEEGLTDALNTPDLYITSTTLREVYEQPEADLASLVRHILGIQKLPGRETRIRGAFDQFLADHPEFTASQLLFLRTVCQAVIDGARLTSEDLSKPPFTRVGVLARLFPPARIEEILTLAQQLAA